MIGRGAAHYPGIFALLKEKALLEDKEEMKHDEAILN